MMSDNITIWQPSQLESEGLRTGISISLGMLIMQYLMSVKLQKRMTQKTIAKNSGRHLKTIFYILHKSVDDLTLSDIATMMAGLQVPLVELLQYLGERVKQP